MEIKNLDLTRSATHQIASSKATPRETAEQIVEKWWIDPVAPDASLDELKSAIEAALLAEREQNAVKAEHLIHELVKPQPMCRDCADENGFCPSHPLKTPCDQKDWPKWVATAIRSEVE